MAGGIGAFILVAGGFFVLGGEFDKITRGYDQRFFTMGERLLTQPRVIWFYLSILLYPMPARLNITHDFTISTGLFQPCTTLPAIVGLSMLLTVGLLLVKRQPMTSFAILFFLLNHVVESSIIPLEMVYEHRNYLPSMFLFVPVAMGLRKLLDHFRNRRQSLYYLLVVSGIGVIMAWGIGTYLRNAVWQTEETLWRDAAVKSPHARRPLHNLAWGYYERTGQMDAAYALYAQAATLRIHSRAGQALSFNNMANIHYRRGEFKKAAALWQEAMNHDPDNPNYRYRCSLALFKAGDLGKAIQSTDNLIDMGQRRGDALVLKGRALLWQKHPRRALDCFQEAFRDHRQSPLLANNLGITLMIMGHYFQAENLFEYAHGLAPDDPTPLVWLARLNFFVEDKQAFKRWVEKMAETFTLVQLERALQADNEILLLADSNRNDADAMIRQRLIYGDK
jgi:tetratricopeptide (TPR) repeat protein